jgi:flagellar hook-associated protein FlgK
MSSILENKQLIHVATEIIVLLGVSFYFNQKIRRLNSQIDDLSQRVSDQDDIIDKHEDMIKKLVDIVNDIKTNKSRTQQNNKPKTQDNLYVSGKQLTRMSSPSPRARRPPPDRPPSPIHIPHPSDEEDDDEEDDEDEEEKEFSPIKVTFSSNPRIEDINNYLGGTDDLDGELSEELEELEEKKEDLI